MSEGTIRECCKEHVDFWQGKLKDERNKVLDEVLEAISCKGCGLNYHYGCNIDTDICREHYISKIEKLRSE